MTVVFHRLSILIVCLLDFYVQAATERYIIYPKDDVSLPERYIFTEMLNELAGPQGNVYTSFWRQGRRQEIRFWGADLSEMAYKELRENPIVSDIHLNEVVIDLFTENELSEKNSTYLFRPTSEMTPSNLSAGEENFAYLTQKAPLATELRALSQPALSGSISGYPNYVYPVGEIPTYIYHVEVGINQRHVDFRGRTVEWLYTGLAIREGVNTPTEAAVGEGHSTCTASKAVGNLYGASKRATLVVVKMPYLTEESVGEVLDHVIDDINDKGRTETSVVSISWGSKETLEFPGTTLGRRLSAQIHELLEMDVVFVCAAGNAALLSGGSRLYADTMPAFLVRFFGFDEKFFVIGNSDINGVRYPTSQLSYPGEDQIYAPGVDIKCAKSTSSTGYTTWTGTSFSAPLVAGVFADLLSTGQLNYHRPYWKRQGGEFVVWNLWDR